MWVLIFFDLPTETKKLRKANAKFRQYILRDGFNMFQFSIYSRYCNSNENATTHIKRIKAKLPAKGHIGILCLTDKQFNSIEIFQNKEATAIIEKIPQLELF